MSEFVLVYEKPEDYSPDSFAVSALKYVEAANALGWTTRPITLNRGDDRVYGIDDLENVYSFVFGSVKFVRNVKSYLIPGVLGYHGAERMTRLFNAKRKTLFNDKMVISTWANLKHNLSFYQDIFDTETLFIRPEQGYKTFSGQTIKNHFDLESIYSISSVNFDTMIGVAPAKKIKSEIRCFVVGFNVVETSFYNGTLNVEGEQSEELRKRAIRFVEDWISQCYISVDCDTVEVIDVAFDEDYKPKVLEINSMSSSGLYMADAKKILSALEPHFKSTYTL